MSLHVANTQFVLVPNSDDYVFLVKETLPPIQHGAHSKTVAPGIALILHGLGANHDTINNQAKRAALKEAGYQTYSMDLFGHGKSSGKIPQLTATNLANGYLATLQAIRESNPGAPLTVMAGSLGAYTTLIGNVLARGRNQTELLPENLVLISPLIDFRRLAKLSYPRTAIQAWKANKILSVPGVPPLPYDLYNEARAERFVMSKIASACCGTVIIAFSTDDRVIPSQTVQTFVTRLRTNERVTLKVHSYANIDHSLASTGQVDPLRDVMGSLKDDLRPNQ